MYVAFSTEISGTVCLHSDLNVSDLSVALLPKPAALSECLNVITVSAFDRQMSGMCHSSTDLLVKSNGQKFETNTTLALQ